MEFIYEYIPYVVVAVIAYHVGKHWAMWTFSQNLSQDPDRMIAILNKIKEINAEVEDNGMPEDAIPLKMEQVGDQVFAYNQITGEFLAQAQSAYQAALLAISRYPGKKFWHPCLDKDHQTA
jgi:hypothetical protein